jgi:hypothetical protein
MQLKYTIASAVPVIAVFVESDEAIQCPAGVGDRPFKCSCGQLWEAQFDECAPCYTAAQRGANIFDLKVRS